MECLVCKHYCDWEHTYIEQARYPACCSYWHEAFLDAYKETSPACKAFVPKNVPVQLNLFEI